MNIWDRQLQEIKDIRAQNRKFYAEILRLREALQWTIKDCDAQTNHESIKHELVETLEEGKDILKY